MERVPPILMELPDELIGERIVLRPRRPEDAAAIWEAVEESREQIRQWLPWVDETRSLDDCIVSARRAWARWILRENFGVTLWEQSTGRFLGGSGLHPINWDTPSFEIGYWLRTSEQGHGYITEAVRLLCDFAFGSLGAARVFICCDAHNERSAAVPRRLGFVHEATLRNDSRGTDGALRDIFVFAMTPEDYAATQPLWRAPRP
jgi:RimJ/RimL family protein N-acetyltransferase